MVFKQFNEKFMPVIDIFTNFYLKMHVCSLLAVVFFSAIQSPYKRLQNETNPSSVAQSGKKWQSNQGQGVFETLLKLKELAFLLCSASTV